MNDKPRPERPIPGDVSWDIQQKDLKGNGSCPACSGKPESLPVLVFIALFAVLYAADPDLRSAKMSSSPTGLLFALNSVFITGLCFFVAWLSFRSYLRGGLPNVLLLGCGVLAFGYTSFAAGWLIRSPYGPNDTLTVHNLGVLFASACFFLSSLSVSLGMGRETEPVHRAPAAGAAYLGIFLLGALLTAAAILDLTPPFFIPGEGPTVIRQVVLARFRHASAHLRPADDDGLRREENRFSPLFRQCAAADRCRDRRGCPRTARNIP